MKSSADMIEETVKWEEDREHERNVWKDEVQKLQE